MPSDVEGMPLSLLEAMSYKNCCLTSDIPECQNVMEDKGIIFERTNVKDLKEKLQYIIDNNNVVNQYKSESQEYIIKKCDWDEVKSRTIELYKEIKNKDSINKKEKLKI